VHRPAPRAQERGSRRLPENRSGAVEVGPLYQTAEEVGHERKLRSAPFGCSAVVGSFGASKEGVAEEARTRGFAAPAFAGCAFVVGLATLSYRVVQGLSSDQGGGSIRVSSSSGQSAPPYTQGVSVAPR
jgi:hypothetical protein